VFLNILKQVVHAVTAVLGEVKNEFKNIVLKKEKQIAMFVTLLISLQL
jgi:hypothetical protein